MLAALGATNADTAPSGLRQFFPQPKAVDFDFGPLHVRAGKMLADTLPVHTGSRRTSSPRRISSLSFASQAPMPTVRRRCDFCFSVSERDAGLHATLTYRCADDAFGFATVEPVAVIGDYRGGGARRRVPPRTR